MGVKAARGMSTYVDSYLLLNVYTLKLQGKCLLEVDCNSTELPIQVESVRKISTEADMKYCPVLSSLELLAKCLLR